MSAHTDRRHHVQSGLMRESLVDKSVIRSTETPVVRMLPDAHVVKIGGRSVLDAGSRRGLSGGRDVGQDSRD
jgi:molybdenum storage protein